MSRNLIFHTYQKISIQTLLATLGGFAEETPRVTTIQKVAALLQKGLTHQEIAEQVGIMEVSVSVYAHRLGIRRKSFQRWSAHDLKILVTMREQGSSFTKISRVLKRPTNNCCARYHKYVKDSKGAGAPLGAPLPKAQAAA